MNSNDIKKKIDMILGKKKVKNRNDYMRIYGVGLGPKISRSQNPKRKRALRLDPLKPIKDELNGKEKIGVRHG
jgi:hypothetical protein